MNESVLSAAFERSGLVANLLATWVYSALSCIANRGPGYSTTSIADIDDFILDRMALASSTAFFLEEIPAAFASCSASSALPDEYRAASILALTSSSPTLGRAGCSSCSCWTSLNFALSPPIPRGGRPPPLGRGRLSRWSRRRGGG